MAKLLFDDDVASGLTPELAVAAARQALVNSYRGRLRAPPRLLADVGETELVFTARGYPAWMRGVRIYLTGLFSSDPLELPTAELRGDVEADVREVDRKAGAVGKLSEGASETWESAEVCAAS